MIRVRVLLPLDLTCLCAPVHTSRVAGALQTAAAAAAAADDDDARYDQCHWSNTNAPFSMMNYYCALRA